jgi:Leucine-rich repeat (LRR) protein
MRNILILWLFTFCNLTSAQIIDFPDANFKNALVNTKCVDTDGDDIGDTDADLNDDGDVDAAEAMEVLNLNVTNMQISNLEGINHFKNLVVLNFDLNELTEAHVLELTKLEILKCSRNRLKSLSVQGLLNLTYFSCYNNELSSLNIEGAKNLTYLSCSVNKLTSIDLQGLRSLTDLGCGSNVITTLDLSGLINLEALSCQYNRLTSLNVEGLTNLITLFCHNNKLESLEIAGLTNLEALSCQYNNLDFLHLEGAIKLKYLNCLQNQLTFLNSEGLLNLTNIICSFNKLTFLNIKGTAFNEYVSFGNNPDLSYICCDENRITEIKNMAIDNGQNCEVNSECSVTNTQDLYTNINTYPNPVSDILYLDTNDHWTKAEIFDIAGRIMRTVSLNGQSIDVNGLESGTYFIRFKDRDKIGLVKFVKI